NWDPYQNTSDVSVAVVNEDKPQKLQSMGKVCVGNMLVEALEQNDKIGWRFLDEAEALENVRAGSCYAAIVIPEDFTKSLTGVLDGKTDKAHLKYYVNEKANAVAPKVTDTGASTIETQVDEQFIATAGKVIAKKLGNLAQRLTSHADGAANDLSSSLDEAHATIDKMDGQLGSLSKSLSDAQQALSGAADRLSALKGKGTAASESLDNVLGNFATTRQNAHDIMGNISTSLAEGASSIMGLSSTATYDVSSLAGDIAAAQSEVDAAIAALEKDLTDSEALEAKVGRTIDVIVEYDPDDDGVRATLAELHRQLSSEHDALTQISDAEAAKIDELRSLEQRLGTSAREVMDLAQAINQRTQTAVSGIQSAQTGAVSTSLLQINTALDTFVQVAQQLSSALRSVDPIVEQVIGVSAELAGTLDQSGDALASTRESLGTIASDLETLQRELATIRGSQEWELIKDLAATNPAGVKEFLTAPVSIDQNRLYPVENYASGVAPFFTSLALWVGGIALVAIFKLEVDETDLGELRPWQAYFGRWALFVLLGALQAVACCTGDLLLGIQCDYPAAFFLAAIVASFAFINIIYALSVAFKHLGKALAFTLIILQVPGSAGMYPLEMMPPFFQAIGPWLPFTYSNNAMREAIAGFYDGNFAKDLLILLAFILPSLLIGVAARRHLVGINAFFDQRLRETDHLMVSEPEAKVDSRLRERTTTLMAGNAGERQQTFEKAYPALK
ncbi:MAG: YhgE/Pip domain-containing protein, partial [Coriobacteriales bacterium]|nr:YhgE/Pip domain-containing protein [Coriobacteriales bacterium]